MSLIVTGTIGIDTVETPAGSAREVLGGSCAYFAAASCLYAPTRLVGVVGDDWPVAHREVVESLDGVDLGGLEVREGSRTFRWGGRYFDSMNQRETLFTELGVLEEPPPTIPAEFTDSRYVFLANTHPGVQLGFIEQLPHRTLVLADTMDLWINVARDELRALFNAIDGIVINDSEAHLLTGETNAITAARRIMEMGPGLIIIKKGEHGSVLVHEDGVAVLPAYPVESDGLVDPTGAGDSFAGGLMGHIAEMDCCSFDTIRDAMAWGTVTASFTVGSFGLDGLTGLDANVLEARMAAFQRAAAVGTAAPPQGVEGRQ